VGNVWVCGGTLVKPSIVITARHCFDDGKIISVMAGTSLIRPISKRNLYYARYVITFPRFVRFNLGKDITVVILDRPVKTSTLHRPIPWLTPNDEATSSLGLPGQPVQISGWGAVNGAGDKYVAKLQAATVRILPNEFTAGYYVVPPDQLVSSKYTDLILANTTVGNLDRW
jgi:hypothetical protein